ncbi:CD63 antigen [Eumeta japonica]|uniref:CD63 antigen n=1 Tax=Eumeta variegata TaxID=151549 RepID=A0A4C1UJ22_EUMVA|nr:CD63 antigen [Eumeta japonica]
MSALIVSVATTVRAIYFEMSFFLESSFFSPATLIVVIGVIMFFVSAIGCVGAIKESTCLINLFACILSLVLVLEIAAAIAAYNLRWGMQQMIDARVRETLPMYYQDVELHCCGVDSYEDWAVVRPPVSGSGIDVNNITVPDSCCAESQYEVVDGVELNECVKLYANGCLPRIIYLVYQSAGLLASGAMTVIVIQVIGIVFAFSLASSIRRAKTEREYRRQMLWESVANSSKSTSYSWLNPNKELPCQTYVPFPVNNVESGTRRS